MYIAGLKLPLSPPQWLEVFVTLSTVDFFRHAVAVTKPISTTSEAKAGQIRPESMPSTVLGRIITPIHGLATFIPPLVYVGAVALNGFREPGWIARWAFSAELKDSTWGTTSRVMACIASFALKHLMDSVFKHLGDQWHFIGRREKSRVVKTGPYAWVRHPGYSSVLLQEVLWSVMFWSYIPLVSLGITASAFAVKMPIEESIILNDDVVREDYLQYMKEVPARILPFVW